MNESEAGLVFFWMGVMLWEFATHYDTATRPAPNVPWFVIRFISIMFYFKALTQMVHTVADWCRSMGWAA